MKIPHLITLKGNHDLWAKDYLQTGEADDRWIRNGGDAAVEAFERHGDGVLQRFLQFFERQLDYFIDEENRLFVHAGIQIGVPMEQQTEDYLFWERTLWQQAIRSFEVYGVPFPDHPYKEIYIGHTPTIGLWPDMKPVNLGNIWNIDQGIKRTGKLTLIDVATKEYWQSDNVMLLYF
jgi:serine/threonine protein phosphatase 1